MRRPLGSAAAVALVACALTGCATPGVTVPAASRPPASGTPTGSAAPSTEPVRTASGGPSSAASPGASPHVGQVREGGAMVPAHGEDPGLPGLDAVTGAVLGASDDPDVATLTWRTADPTLRCVRLRDPSGERTVRGDRVEAQRELERARVPGLTSLRSYRIGDCAARWSDPVSLASASDRGALLYFGDPQLTDAASGWRQTVSAALTAHADARLLLLAGDITDVPDDAGAWERATAPESFRGRPVVSLRGNHDIGSAEFDARFAPDGHGDRVLRRGDVLLVVLDTYAGDVATHEATLRRAVTAHPDAPWRVVAFHQAPFSGGGHLDAADVRELRDDLAPVLSRLGIDLVLNGHDHHYARSLLMDGATPVAGSGGDTLTAVRGRTLYVTAGSSSGSWYLPLAAARSWTAVVAQPFRPSYVAVEADARSLRVTATTPTGESIDRVTLRR